MPAIPTYTIQRDPPWIPARSAMRPPAVTMKNDPFKSGSEDVYHAHPAQQISDHGPQIRQSRLPIFKQVRSMLHRPPPITTPNNPKWDEYTGELSESGKPSKVKPSTYVSPYDGASQTPPSQPIEKSKKNRKNLSPVSVLRDEDFTPVEHVNEADRDLSNRSPVSPVSEHSQADDQFHEAIDPSLLPEPLSPNVRRLSQQTSPGSYAIKRKPLSRSTSAAENYPPVSPQHSPSNSSDLGKMDEEIVEPEKQNAKSHFSWTTYAPTARHSIDTMATQEPQGYVQEPQSRFSWSTVATQPAVRAESPPPPAPPLPNQYAAPPVQSILSRRRPVQRTERAEWAPAQYTRSKDSTPFATPVGSSTPTSATTTRQIQLPKSSTPTSASPSTGKALPLPPQLSAANNLTHLETLLAQERDIVLQRTNVERGIREMEKIAKASPLEVPFSTVRDTKKRLAEFRTRLDEVRLEERDIGVAITRARRKEEKETGGDGETLWVRRVTS